MKSIFEQMGGTYIEVKGYLFPDIEMPTEEETKIRFREFYQIDETIPDEYFKEA